MAVSMTGFGRSKTESGSFTVHVEIKTVNHRFCEYHIRMPRQLLKVEEKIKKILGAYIRRGRVEVFITVEGEGAVSRQLRVEWDLIEEYYQFIKKAQLKYGIEGTITLQELINREDLIHIEETEGSDDELENAVLAAAEDAACHLTKMRQDEGIELVKDITSHLHQLEAFVNSLRKHAPSVVQQYKERLTRRMQEFLNGQADEARILTEVAVFSEKADINEELIRLNSHIQQFFNILIENNPIGRKLDFLVQEMNREANTIGSKANDSIIARDVVEIKSLLEKMKEQIQNIE
ncbi:YicC/YloC family endoribonuclease [Neobacillus sp. PS3-34]|uniref:YicC/YloC family endoribonuclease n=1 Tax=Neobacillus sp. PS3-34 TaxID=3070678 RepID=UPI0027DF398D|nr:YicC/YloC family endoribonuclease [Neobacillus sp. PS3-34]WML49321.1 YicC/YloC family endoribonuclease [Neobacillus sp. PS3-34]